MSYDVAKLPKWAQDHITKLQRERDTAVAALNKYVDDQTESPISITEMESIGEQAGPSFKKRYIQGRGIEFDWRGVYLRVLLVRPGDSQRQGSIELTFHAPEDKLSTVGMIPTSNGQVCLICKDELGR